MQGQETTELRPVYLGVDVSKARLDLGGPEGEVEGFANDRRGIAALVRRVRRLGEAPFVVLEATGRLSPTLPREGGGRLAARKSFARVGDFLSQ